MAMTVFSTATAIVHRLPFAHAQDLSLLVSFLQQLNGEQQQARVTRVRVKRLIGTLARLSSSQPGSNGQHAFHQQLHQGPDIIPCDFIVPLKRQCQ